MSRDPRLFLDDRITACEKIRRYLAGRPRNAFESAEQAFDAVLKNLEVIGEAAKRIAAEFRDSRPEIAWRGIAGLRDAYHRGALGRRFEIPEGVRAQDVEVRLITDSRRRLARFVPAALSPSPEEEPRRVDGA